MAYKRNSLRALVLREKTVGTVKKPNKAILFAGLLYNIDVKPKTIYSILEDEFGRICLESQTFPFIETNYYKSEMGENLRRVYIAFDTLLDMEQIVDIKLKTNKIEDRVFTGSGKRKVNIDPGYLTSAKVVLATTKNFQHRIYLNRGIYAEVTLRYMKNGFSPWKWTFKDYKRKEAVEFFNKLRILYRQMLKSHS